MAAAADVAVASSAKASSNCSVLEVAELVEVASARPVMLLLVLRLPVGWLLLMLSVSLHDVPSPAAAAAAAAACEGDGGRGGAWTDKMVG
jgi:hypothetical protein